jgi:predicted lipoprotein with Yx(FWY)xxD motif
VAGVIEVAAFAVLAALAIAPAPADGAVNGAAAGGAGFPALIPAVIARAAGWTTAVLAIAALAVLGVAVAGASPAAAGATGTGAGLKTTTIGGTTVLTNARGFTVYWFAPDTPAASKCYCSCAAYWPPVTGTAAAARGCRAGSARSPGPAARTSSRTTGIRRTPGQARGNNLKLNGGLWHEVRVSR